MTEKGPHFRRNPVGGGGGVRGRGRFDGRMRLVNRMTDTTDNHTFTQTIMSMVKQ